jgi:hypothetical protein
LQGLDLQPKPLPAPDVVGAVTSGAAGGASSITLKVPVELTRIPAVVRQAIVVCGVGVGAVSGATTWSRDTSVGGGSSTITFSTSARTLKEATHYNQRRGSARDRGGRSRHGCDPQAVAALRQVVARPRVQTVGPIPRAYCFVATTRPAAFRATR